MKAFFSLLLFSQSNRKQEQKFEVKTRKCERLEQRGVGLKYYSRRAGEGRDQKAEEWSPGNPVQATGHEVEVKYSA